MSNLATAIRIAAAAHEQQVDKAGQLYILHPLRVLQHVQRWNGPPDAQIAAVLHDVVEDTAWTLAGLAAAGFSPAVVAAVDALTRRPAENYLAFVQRAARNPIARMVKRADLLDNLDITRIPQPTERDWERLRRYQSALRLLNDDPPPDSVEAAAGDGPEGRS